MGRCGAGLARFSPRWRPLVTHVMRSLSARILIGFFALLITFAAFVVTIVLNLREVEDQASLILAGYVPLAMTLADLAQRQDDLRQYLEQGNVETPALASLRKSRDAALHQVVGTLAGLPTLVSSGSQAAAEVARQTAETGPLVDELDRTVAGLVPLYAMVEPGILARLPTKAEPSPQPTPDPRRARSVEALLQLRERERAIDHTVASLRARWVSRTSRTKTWLSDNERVIRQRAVYLGIPAMAFGLAVTVWVALSLRPLLRLREGARRIAAGDYGKRVPETGPTEIADLARELNSLGRAVQEREAEKLRAARLAMVGKMAAQIAHEVRNPLSSIGLNTELIEDELDDSAGEARELCRKIHAEVNRLTQVTETYLGMRGGKPKLARESLNAIVDDLVGFVRKDLASRQVELTTELDPSDPAGTIDANQIRQCLINLVRNAADAVAVKGGGHVVLRTRGERDRVEIAVVDDGVGIASDDLPRLFDPSFSTKEGGNGLGLALAQQIIHDHGGEIHVASRVGRGTTFTLSVPAA
jgi:two-component system, NtrC family, sensor kinase